MGVQACLRVRRAAGPSSVGCRVTSGRRRPDAVIEPPTESIPVEYVRQPLLRVG